jgi:menaquinone-specific isochorismate synthase
MESLALIRWQGKRFLVAWGPFESRAQEPVGEAFFYVQDFLLQNPKPFKIPRSWRLCEAAELRELLPARRLPQVNWKALDEAPYLKSFHEAQACFRSGEWTKAVPVIVEEGELEQALDVGDWLAPLLDAHESLVPYAYFEGSRGFVGATPEWLFQRQGNEALQTMALAGSLPLERAQELLSDPKLVREHTVVADDLKTRLAAWGRVEAGALEVARLPSLAHGRTQIRLHEERPAGFGAWVGRLHPTPALGIAPRSAQNTASLRRLDAYGTRGVLGAPFGASLPAQNAKHGLAAEPARLACVVALRNLQIDGQSVRLVAGAGLLAESRLDLELAELALKRRSVKAYWQLA